MVHSVLARACPEQIKRDGAAFAIIENALPDDYYEALAASYPSLEVVAGRGPLENNWAYRKTATELIAREDIPTIWKDFLSYHCSKPFFDQVCDIWEQDIADQHPALEENFGKPLREFSVGVRTSGRVEDPTYKNHDLVLDCQIAVNSPVTEVSSVRGAHLDSPRKLFNSQLYFRHPDDRSTGGLLQFYRLKDDRVQTNWSDIDQDLVERTHVVPSRANQLVMFLNSTAALHGVSPRSVTPLPRRYVSFCGECYGGKSSAFFRPPDRTSKRGFWPGVIDRWR